MKVPGGIWMSGRQQFTYGVLTDFNAGKISRAEAALLLGVDERSVSRKSARFREKGLVGLQHGNTGRIPVNRTSLDLKATVLKLVREKYFDFNVAHCLEKLRENEGIELEYSVFYSWCREANVIKRTKRRCAKVRHLRSRLPVEGMMLQLDGSHHLWNGKDTWVLIGLIDDATSKIPWAEFFTSEDTLNCMTVLQRVVEKFGIPEMIYTDKAGWLGGTTKREGFSQFLNACEYLGIRVIFANSPQAKGRIERAWNTFQDRLIPEMRLHGLKSIQAANHYLQEEMLPKYWNVRNAVPAKVEGSRYKPLSCEENLNEIFCIKETRKVNGNHTISWENSIYAVTPPEGVSLKGRTVEIRTYQNMTSKSFFAGREIPFQLVQQAPAQKPLRVNGIAGVKPTQVKEWFNEGLNNKGEKACKKEKQPENKRQQKQTPAVLRNAS
jgi:hypothetical protein